MSGKPSKRSRPELGARIRDAQASRGLANEDLVVAFKVSPATIHNWRTGSTVPGRDMMRDLAVVLGVDPVWLARGEKVGDGPVDGSAVSAIVEQAANHARPGLVLGTAIQQLQQVLDRQDVDAQAEGWAIVCGEEAL
jgi:transcriptional regulator with XRE-family HTH domain